MKVTKPSLMEQNASHLLIRDGPTNTVQDNAYAGRATTNHASLGAWVSSVLRIQVRYSMYNYLKDILWIGVGM